MIISVAGSLDPQGPAARVMAELWWVMLGLGVVVFAVVLMLGLGAVFRRRDRDTDPDTGDATDTTHRRWLVLGGVALPVVVITVVFGYTVWAMRAVPNEAPPDALVIEVVGHQWWWEIHYPEQGLTTANELHIPAGRPIALQLTSADVIHSFWVPELGGKLDLLPEDINTLVLQSDEPGEYRGQCAEFCGLQHANMRFRVVAHPPEEFAAWLQRQLRPAATPTTEPARRGEQVFVEARCGDCHTLRGADTSSNGLGPDLTHLASRRTLAAGVLPNTREHLTELITRPQEVKEGIQMPSATLDQSELEALLSYLESLR